MTRCEHADEGNCPKYNQLKRAVLNAEGRTDSMDMGSLTLTGTDMQPACKEAGLPCYQPDHQSVRCYSEMQRNQPAESLGGLF